MTFDPDDVPEGDLRRYEYARFVYNTLNKTLMVRASAIEMQGLNGKDATTLADELKMYSKAILQIMEFDAKHDAKQPDSDGGGGLDLNAARHELRERILNLRK